VERLARDKNYSLLQKAINNGQKSFIVQAPDCKLHTQKVSLNCTVHQPYASLPKAYLQEGCQVPML
jgi:hypothetical protein